MREIVDNLCVWGGGGAKVEGRVGFQIQQVFCLLSYGQTDDNSTGPYLASNVGVAALASVLRPGVSPCMLCNLVCSKYPCYLSIIFLVFSGSGTCSCFIICSCKEVIILHCH